MVVHLYWPNNSINKYINTQYSQYKIINKRLEIKTLIVIYKIQT